MQNVNSNYLKGIDVSNWQGNIDFNFVKNSGIQVVYTKVSEGTNYIDPFFKSNYSKAKSQGLDVGFYHFFTPVDETSAIAQANYFVNAISGLSPDCKLALDFETTNNLDNETLSKLADIFLKQVKKLTGLDVVLYTYTSFAANNFTSSLSIYPIWIAEYGVRKPKDNPIWSTWIGFQYSDCGLVSGISGNVDLDYFTNEILLSSKTPVPKPPTPTPIVNPINKYIYYTVQSGDTLSEIASKYNTTTENLSQINKIPNPNLIYIGEIIKVPSNGYSTDYYTVQSGDTLSGIASKFGLSTSELASINNISNPNLIYPGQTLKLLSNSTSINYYTVKSGDTLSEIASKFGLTTSELAKLNNISNPNIIYAGQVLKI